MDTYKDWDQETLDREYSARGTVPVPVFEAAVGHQAELSEHYRKTMPCKLDVAYGPSSDEVFDIFPAGDSAPLFIFIHGGYWRALSQKESTFMAKPFIDRGVAACAINYSLAPGASLDEIVRQCRAAIAWIYANAATIGVDPERLYVAGSSAGGHLVGMMITGGWQDEFDVPGDVIKGACSLSGLYDLEPLLHAEPNTWLNMDAAAARRLSPIHHLPEQGCPLIVSYGGNETSEFKRQTDDFADAWRAAGFSCTHADAEHRNHFDIVMDFCEPTSKLYNAIFAQIGE